METDANSVEKVKVKDRSPKLHYIYPTCFEAGRAMEFVACGTDLLQPKFRYVCIMLLVKILLHSHSAGYFYVLAFYVSEFLSKTISFSICLHTEGEGVRIADGDYITSLCG